MNDHVQIGCEIFILKDNQLLLGKRKNSFGAGDWGLPGGHQELGEKLIDTAKRELREELGITDAKLKMQTIADGLHSYQYVHISFLLENFDGNFKLMEPEKCEEWKFFPLDNLPENIFVGHLEILETFKKNALYLY